MWEEDRRHGKGAFEDLNGYLKSYSLFEECILLTTCLTLSYRSYKGEWARDVKQGRGLMVFSTGVTYEGMIHEGLVRLRSLISLRSTSLHPHSLIAATWPRRLDVSFARRLSLDTGLPLGERCARLQSKYHL